MSMVYSGPVPKLGPRPMIMDIPRSPTVTMAQGPAQPWASEEEGEEYAADPRTFLLKKCASFMGAVEVMHNWIVLATHYLPPFTVLPNGTRFYRSDQTLEEVQYQGKVGLVIAKGPIAFMDDPEAGVRFHGQNVEIGEWVSFDRPRGGQNPINRVHCRYLKDVQVMLKVKGNPELVY